MLQWAALSLYSETGTGKTFLLAHATIICVNSFVSFFLTRPQKLRTTDAVLMWDSVCDIFCTKERLGVFNACSCDWVGAWGQEGVWIDGG